MPQPALVALQNGTSQGVHYLTPAEQRADCKTLGFSFFGFLFVCIFEGTIDKIQPFSSWKLFCSPCREVIQQHKHHCLQGISAAAARGNSRDPLGTLVHGPTYCLLPEEGQQEPETSNIVTKKKKYAKKVK